MINTIIIKKQQLEYGFFTIGSGPEIILVMGSCRVCNFVTYLADWNEKNNNRFTIHSLDPFNWLWDKNDNRVNQEEVISTLETNEQMLKMISSVDIFIHEWYANFGMFNCSVSKEKNIYQFNMNPKIDICIPSWNDIFVLFNDIATFDVEIRKKCMQDLNVLGRLSEEVQREMFHLSQNNLNRFFDVCDKSDIPEFKEYFRNNFLFKRLWWSYNHTSKHFTLAIFKLMNEKFLHLDLSKGFDENHIDIFANNYTHLTDLDVKWRGYKWDEEIVPFKL